MKNIFGNAKHVYFFEDPKIISKSMKDLARNKFLRISESSW